MKNVTDFHKNPGGNLIKILPRFLLRNLLRYDILIRSYKNLIRS